MMRWLVLTMMALAWALPAAAQTGPAPAGTPATVRVAMETSEGRFVLELEREKAPITVGNFLRYVDQKRLDGTVFYRTVRVAPNFGFV
ncbi:MAG: peptidylprolyl isomerase, partial [Sphingomonas sp.]